MSIFSQYSTPPINIHTNSDRQFNMQFHSHVFYEIYYFHKGKCNYLIGDKIHVLSPGDLIIMHGMTLHRPNVDQGIEYVRTIIHFDPSYIQGMLQYPFTLNVLKPFQELRNHKIHLNESGQQAVTARLEELEQFVKQDDPVSFHRFHSLFLDLLYMVYGYCKQTLDTKAELPSARERHAQSVITYIEENYHNEIDLEQIEQSLHVSRYYLVKIFKEVTGITIFTYLYQRRINQAKIIFLLEKDKTVTEVCFLSGFKHPAHFSRTFKQYVGSTPEQYRRSILSQT